MLIQFNSDHNITGSEKLSAPLEALLSDELSRFGTWLTFSDRLKIDFIS